MKRVRMVCAPILSLVLGGCLSSGSGPRGEGEEEVDSEDAGPNDRDSGPDDQDSGPPGWCGDGHVDPPEECDDGNAEDDDDCPTTCEPSRCGDGFVRDGTEVCDDGTNDDAYGGCAPDCLSLGPHCGDGEVNGPEVCDNTVNDGSYDGCAPDCLSLGPYCGDGVVNGREACDALDEVDGDGCNTDCGTLLWERTYEAQEFDVAEDLIVDSAGDLVVVGIEAPRDVSRSEAAHAWIRKYDADGTEIWTTRHPADAAHGVAELSDGSYAVVGYYGWDFWVARFDSDGNEEWSVVRDFDGDVDIAWAVAAGDDGNTIAVGYSHWYDNVARRSDESAWLRVFDPDGREVWSHDCEDESIDPEDWLGAWDVTRTNSGDIAVVGQIRDHTDHAWHPWIRILAPDGSDRWSRVIDEVNTGGPYPASVTVVDESEFVLATAWWRSDFPVRSDFQLWARRFDADGETVWTYEDEPAGDVPVTAVAALPDGGVRIVSEGECVLDQIDGAGNLDWTQIVLDEDHPGMSGQGIATDSDGNTYVAGSISGRLGSDGWIGKLAP